METTLERRVDHFFVEWLFALAEERTEGGGAFAIGEFLVWQDWALVHGLAPLEPSTDVVDWIHQPPTELFRDRLEDDDGSGPLPGGAVDPDLTRVSLSDLFDHLLDDDDYYDGGYDGGYGGYGSYSDTLGERAYLEELEEQIAQSEADENEEQVYRRQPSEGGFVGRGAPAGAFHLGAQVFVVWGMGVYALVEDGPTHVAALPQPLTPVYVRGGRLVFREHETFFVFDPVLGEWLEDGPAVDCPFARVSWTQGLKVVTALEEEDANVTVVLDVRTVDAKHHQFSADGNHLRLLTGERPIHAIEDGRWVGPSMPFDGPAPWRSGGWTMAPADPPFAGAHKRGFGLDGAGRVVEADDGWHVRVGGRVVHRLRYEATRVDVSSDGTCVLACSAEGIECVRLEGGRLASGPPMQPPRLSVAASFFGPPADVRFRTCYLPKDAADADQGYISYLYEMVGGNVAHRVAPVDPPTLEDAP